jgi:hypothetical protein
MSTHDAPHEVRPAAQMQWQFASTLPPTPQFATHAHWPLTQPWPSPPQALPQAPQLLASVIRFVSHGLVGSHESNPAAQ